MESQTILYWYLGEWQCMGAVLCFLIQPEMTLGKFLALIWQLLSAAEQQTYLRSSRARMAYDSSTVKQTDAEWFAKCQTENCLWDSGDLTPSLELYPLMTLLSSAILHEAGMIHPPPAVQYSYVWHLAARFTPRCYMTMTVCNEGDGFFPPFLP